MVFSGTQTVGRHNIGTAYLLFRFGLASEKHGIEDRSSRCFAGSVQRRAKVKRKAVPYSRGCLRRIGPVLVGVCRSGNRLASLASIPRPKRVSRLGISETARRSDWAQDFWLRHLALSSGREEAEPEIDQHGAEDCLLGAQQRVHRRRPVAGPKARSDGAEVGDRPFVSGRRLGEVLHCGDGCWRPQSSPPPFGPGQIAGRRPGCPTTSCEWWAIS